MDIGFWIELSSRFDECVHEFIILLSTNSGLFKAKIEFVVEKFFVICSTIEDDGKGSIGMDSGTESGKDEFGHGD